MPELSIELDKWEQRAFDKNTSMSIEVDGDAAVITAPAHIIKRAIDLSLCHYVEFDGYVRTVLHDPIPHRARMCINSLLQRIARRKK